MEEIWAGKGWRVIVPKVTDHIHDMEILLKKILSLYWPLERQPPSSWRRWWAMFLLASPPGKGVWSPGRPLDFVVVSQTYTLFNEVGGSLKSGPYFDALPEQALPTGWGTGTGTTLIDLFLWQPSYWFVPASSLPWTSWMWKASGSYYISLPVEEE